MMLKLMIFLGLVALLTFGDVVNGSCTGGTVNGCSTSKYTPYRKKFTPSCNRHDVCYDCGVKFGKSRNWCDIKFKRNMKKSCGRNWLCKAWANTYYKTVDLFGGPRYNKSPKSYCGQSWVQGCL